jgi:hypothetical protein
VLPAQQTLDVEQTEALRMDYRLKCDSKLAGTQALTKPLHECCVPAWWRRAFVHAGQVLQMCPRYSDAVHGALLSIMSGKPLTRRLDGSATDLRTV